MVRPSFDAPANRDGPRVNGEINARQIRLIDQDGEMKGVVSLMDGLQMAAEAGLDLVEISPGAEPPVCKILDMGKFKYEQQKKAAEARKRQKVVEIKEIRLRPMIDDNDFNIKLSQARRFLDEGDKVKVTLKFRGREMTHQHLGMEVLAKVRDLLADIGKVEQFPRLEGRQMVMVLTPAKG